MSVEGANFTMCGTDAEEDFDNVPTDQDIVKKLDMEFETPGHLRSQTGKSNGTAVDFDPKKDHMRVFLRIKPFSDDEINKGENQKCIDVVDEHTMIAHAPKDSHTYKNSVHGNTKASNKFTFSNIFGQDTSQKEFFDTAMLGTVKDFVDGQNCLVFTYGVTNSGKTYTVQGVPHDGGILPRALDVLFNSISGKQLDDMSLKPKMFCDVVRLSTGEMEKEILLKENTLKIATSEEPDMQTLLGGSDTSDVSSLTVNSTTNAGSISNLSEDSLMTSRFSTASTTSTAKPSLEGVSKDSLETLFEETESRIREEGTIDVDFQGQVKFGVWVSFAEIYNEQIFDLLDPPPKKKKAKRNILHLRDDKNGVPYIKGLREICVRSADEAYQILNIGKKNLQFACTKLNHNSSRSHCIFTVKLLRVVDKDMPNMARMSMLSLCDLAGSERNSKTQGLGDRIKEASNINTSLLTLGRCIKTLRHNQLNKDQPRIVPFRDSKLTRVFQSFFCGKGRASMVVNINQLASLFDETLHALKYSAIAKEVIVVQEEEKKPPPPKKRGMVSLAFKQMSRDRTTIGWATPGTIAKVIEEEEAGCNLPLPEDDDDDLQDPDQDADHTQVASLFEVVDHLKEELINARKEKMSMEMKIREEVVKEMAQQLIVIESQYSERVKEAQYLAEEKAEKKIELLTMSIKKTKKRKHFMDQDDDDEYVSSVLLHAEQVKVEKQDVIIASLKQQKAKLEKTVKEYTQEKETLMEKISKLQFDNTHLNEKLQQFNTLVEEQAQLFKENNDQLVQLDQRLRERDSRIAELERMIQSKACPSCQESTTEMGGMISRLADVEQELTDKEEAIIKLEQMSDMVTCELSDKVAKIEELESALADSQRITKTAASARDIETQTESQSGDTDTKAMAELLEEIESLKSQLQLKESEMIQLKGSSEEKEAKLDKVVGEKSSVIEDLKGEMARSEIKLQETLAELNSTNEEVSLLKEKVKRLEVDTEKLITDLDEARCSLEAKTNEVNVMRTATDLNEAMKERLNCLEVDLQASKETAKCQDKASAKKTAELEQKLKELETRLQTKELNLTKCETEMFESLEKVSDRDQECGKLKGLVSERERELVELKESLQMAEKAKSELQADGEALKTKIAAMEQTLNDRVDSENKNESLVRQIEELRCLVGEKDKALSTVTDELGGLRDSLDSESGNVTTLEASLHQANEAARCKGLEVTELEERLKIQQSENTDLKDTVQTLKSQAEECMLKLRSQQSDSLSELSEKYTEQCLKVKVLGEKVTDLECELGVLKLEQESQSSDKEQQLVSELQELQVKLDGDKQKLESRLKMLKVKLEEKEQLVEKVCGDCDKLKRSLEGERKESRGVKNQLQELECVFENVERELKQEKGQREDNKAEISKLQLNIHELENKLKDSESNLKDSKSIVQELEQKVAGLQVSLDIAGEIEDDLQEISANLEQMTEERDRLYTKQREMEQEITQLRSQGDQVNDSSEELVQELRQKIRQLEGKVDDAEYKSQMSNRQMRREKAQLEKLLKETEGSLTESESKTQQLEEQLAQVKSTERELYHTKVEQHKKKAEKLEDVVHDLEHCLRSSKDSEAKVQKLAEEYRHKYRDLEKQYSVIEDNLKDLYDKRDSIASEKDHNEFRFHSVIDEKQKSLEELRSTICDLREEIATLQDIIDRNSKDYGRQMYEKNELIAGLEQDIEKLHKRAESSESLNKRGSSESDVCESEGLTNKLAQCQAEVRDRDMELEVKVSRIAILENDLKEQVSEVRVREQKIDCLEGELEEKQREVEVYENRLECIEQELEGKIAEVEKLTQLETHLVEQGSKLSECQKIDSLEVELEGKTAKIDSLKAELEGKTAKIDSLNVDLEGKTAKIDSLEVDLEGKAANIDSLEEELEGNIAKAERFEVELERNTSKIDRLEAELKEKIAKIDILEAGQEEKIAKTDSLEAELEGKTAKIDSLEAELEEKIAKIEFLEAELERKMAKIDGLEAELESKLAEVQEGGIKLTQLETVQGTKLSECQQKIGSLEAELEEKITELEKGGKKLIQLEADLVKKESKLSECQEKIDRLEAELEEVTRQFRELSDKDRDRAGELSEVREKYTREISEKQRDMQELKTQVTEKDGLIEELRTQCQGIELEKSQERESKLREQMRDWGCEMEQQTAKFVLLQEKLRQTEADKDTQTSQLQAQQTKLKQIKCEVEELKSSLQSKEDRCQEMKRAGQQEVDSLRLEVKQLQLDLEVKEKRVEKKNKKISELLQDCCEQDKKYETAFHEAQANEKVIEQLKKTLEEQEQVMEMQDTHIKKKEEDYEQMLKKAETVTEKYNALLKESAESTSHLRQVKHIQRKTQDERADQRKEIEELQQQIAMQRQRSSELEGERQLVNIDRALIGDLESRLMTAKTDHERTKQELIKCERDKLRLEADMKECNNELRNMERDLEQARKGREQMRRELERSQEKEVEITKVKNQLQQEFSQTEVVRGQAQLLKQKFHSLEEQKGQLEKELGVLKDHIKMSEDKKELELQKWRHDRDTLVSQLQDILTKKDAEIKTLKEASGSLSNHSNVCEEVSDLKAQLTDKDAIIAELSSHLDKASTAPKTRRGRHKKEKSTAGSDEEMESLKKELICLQQQLDCERQKSVKQMKAKDEIMSDLKGANETLQSHLKRLSHSSITDPSHIAGIMGTLDIEEESLGIQCDLDGTPTLGSAGTDVKATKRGKKQRGRPKKRKSSETEDTQSIGSEDLNEPHTSSSKASRGGGKRSNSTRHARTHKKSFRLDENEEPSSSMGVIKEEDVVDLSMLEINKSTNKALNNSTNLLDLPEHGRLLNSTPKTDNRQATFVSPCTDARPPPPASTIKKKKRLHNIEVNELFAASPHEPTEVQTKAGKSDVHQTVKRKLRSRKHRQN